MLVKYYNSLLGIEISSSKRPRAKPRLKTDFVGIVAMVGVLMTGFLTPFATTVGVITKLDPIHYVFEEFLLPDPYYRSMSVILAEPLVRILLVYFILMEIFRTMSICLVLVVGILFIIISVEQRLQKASCTTLSCLDLYIRLRLMLAKVGKEFIGKPGNKCWKIVIGFCWSFKNFNWFVIYFNKDT